jgi:hypothetical protein
LEEGKCTNWKKEKVSFEKKNVPIIKNENIFQLEKGTFFNWKKENVPITKTKNIYSY